MSGSILWPNFCVCKSNFTIIEDELEALHARLARMPTRGELSRAALGIIFATTGLVIA
jgi:hypothetical protein